MSRLPTYLRRGGAGVLGAISVLVFFVGISESWLTVILPDAERIASYHFGSEAMVGQGGWNYLNPDIYGWTALVGGTFAAVALALLAFGVGRRSWRFAATGVGVLLVLVFALEGLGSVQWERRATSKQWAATP